MNILRRLFGWGGEKRTQGARRQSDARRGGREPEPVPGQPEAETDRKGDQVNQAQRTGGQRSRTTGGQTRSQRSEAATERDQAPSGRLYLQFRGASRDVDREVKLTGDLEKIRARHNFQVFPPGSTTAPLLDAFMDIFFPDGCQGEYLVANVSLDPKRPRLLIRPAVISPRMRDVLPAGISLAIKGYLWDNRSDPDNPVLYVSEIVDLSHCDPRPFERRLRAQTITDQEHVFPASRRTANCLTQEFVQSLPLISRETDHRLAEWMTYLRVRERLIAAAARGLRYVAVEVTDEGLVRFLVVCPSEAVLRRHGFLLRSTELVAVPVDDSSDSWEFRPDPDARLHEEELGEVVGKYEPASFVPASDIPWPEPFAAWLTVRPAERFQDEFSAASTESEREAVCQAIRQAYPAEGFLTVSSIGDRVLLSRMRAAIRTLREQGGYAPFLTSYFFDISQARVPRELVEVPEDQWALRLNDSQRHAVRVMLSAPDIALIQGPPGTGKTTVIAEGVYQFVRRGRTVLVASQANLAVDNALERLPRVPEIRAVRLTHKGDPDNPYSLRNVLSTYYGSIADRCERETLGRFQELDDQRPTLQEWLQRATLVEHDADEARRLLAERERTWRSVCDRLERARRLNQRVERARQEADAVLACADLIDGAAVTAAATTVPEHVSNEIARELIGPLTERLRTAGFALSDASSAGTTTAPLGTRLQRVLKRWEQVHRAAARLRQDLTTAERQTGETFIDPKLNEEIQELRAYQQTLAKQLETDASVLREFQDVSRKLRELQSSATAALDLDWYRGLLRSDHVLLRPDLTRAAVVEQLSGLLAAIEQIDSWLRSSRRALVTWLRQEAVRLRRAAGEPTATDGLEAECRVAEAELRDTRRRLEDVERRIEQLRQEACRRWHIDQGELAACRQQVDARLRELTRQANDLAPLREACEGLLRWWVGALRDRNRAARDQATFLDTYIQSCNVVGVSCTENPRTLESHGHTSFDVVIVDEVSKVTPPELLIPLLRGRVAILVGDHRQLPPLFRDTGLSWEEVREEVTAASASEGGDEDGDDDALPLSVFSDEQWGRFRRMVTSSLFKELFETAPEPLRAFLTIQYRMHPQIMEVVNYFYDHLLECGLANADSGPDGRAHGITLCGPRGRPYLTPDVHVLWVDTSVGPQGRPFFEESMGTSKVNRLEAAVIAWLLGELDDAFGRLGYGSSGRAAKRVGVVSFYGRQIRAIRESQRRLQRFRSRAYRAIRVDIDTVDRYQGRERPVILVSLVRRPRRRLSPHALTAQYQRINVALSRAQELLIIVGSCEVFQKYPVDLPYVQRPGSRKVPVYRYIVDHVGRMGGLARLCDVATRDQLHDLLWQPAGLREARL